MTTPTKGRACTGKRRHPTKAAAEEQRRALIRAGGVRLNAYRCKHCDGWHVGHLPKPRKTR